MDTSVDLYETFRKLSPKGTGGLVRMRAETFKDAAVPAKHKILSALAIVVATKCEPCIKGYTKMAYESGATLDELVEYMNVALTEAGCPAEQWTLKALETYYEMEQGNPVNLEICCHEG
jgi:AhpD family alkylhydroperoxidase